ncbi:MAG: hypothetical protein ACK5DM_11155 [Planctomyces sp.]
MPGRHGRQGISTMAGSAHITASIASATLTQTHALTPQAALWPEVHTPALQALQRSSDIRPAALAQQTH